MAIRSLFDRAILCFAIAVALQLAPAIAAAKRATHYPGRSEYRAPKAEHPPTVDGIADEDIWQRAPWQELTHRWLGPEYSAEDFQGRFKVVWTAERLYVLAEIVDDILFDSHRDPLVQYWDDDCLEIFVDEDYSGGDHQYNHNAFAYHVSLDNQAIDIGTDKLPHSYSDHVESRWRQRGNKIIWELAIDIYADDYADGSDKNVPVKLSTGKVMGLMIAWCDNDGSELRENFVGSESAPGEKKDRGWIDAGLFGSLLLVDLQ
ncbi:MAG: CBM9 family sugar-binding protein [Polyangiales bacterium]